MSDHCPIHLEERRADGTCRRCEELHRHAASSSLGGSLGGAKGYTTLDRYDEGRDD